MFKHCHRMTQSGYQRTEWPDGGSYLDQENIVVSVFSVMKGEVDELIRARQASQ